MTLTRFHSLRNSWSPFESPAVFERWKKGDRTISLINSCFGSVRKKPCVNSCFQWLQCVLYTSRWRWKRIPKFSNAIWTEFWRNRPRENQILHVLWPGPKLVRLLEACTSFGPPPKLIPRAPIPIVSEQKMKAIFIRVNTHVYPSGNESDWTQNNDLNPEDGLKNILSFRRNFSSREFVGSARLGE